MQSVSSRIWTRVAVFISYVDNNYTTGTSIKTRTCWWILWSQFFMHRIYFISWKKEKARIEFMNFSQKYMGSVLGGHPVLIIFCLIGFVLLDINSCRLFYKKMSCLYLYIYIICKKKQFGGNTICKPAKAHLFAHSSMISCIIKKVKRSI